MTRRLVKLKKSAKEVVLLHNREEQNTDQLKSVIQPKYEIQDIPSNISNEDRAVSRKEGILIGPQDFDPGVEKLNLLKGDIEIKGGTNVTVDKDKNNLIISTGETGVLSINSRKGDIILNTDSSSNIKITRNGNTFTFGEKSTDSGVTSIQPNDGTPIKGDVILANGDNINIKTDENNPQKIIVSSPSDSFVKTLRGSYNQHKVGPDAEGNINIMAGPSGNLRVKGVTGGIEIDVSGGSIVINFRSLENILLLDPISERATVKDLRKTVNQIIEYLKGFYNDNNHNSTPTNG